MICEAIKADLENSKETSFKNTITSTLSLITVLFEDLFQAIILHREFSGEKVRLEPSTLLLNQTDSSNGYVFNIDILLMRLMHSKKNCWCCLRVNVSLVTGKPKKICIVF
jgi:hypothetical protein